MEKKRAHGSTMLPLRQVAPAEFVQLIDTLATGAESVHYIAVWKSGDEGDGRSIDELRDVSRFDDFEALEWIHLAFLYPSSTVGHDRVNIDLSSGEASLRWTGAVGADKARRFQQVWELLPGTQGARRRLLLGSSLSLVSAALIIALSNLILLVRDRSNIWLIVAACVFFTLAVASEFWRHREKVRQRLAPSQTFISKRVADQWSDEKHRTAIVVGIAGVAASLLGTVASVVVAMLTAKN